MTTQSDILANSDYRPVLDHGFIGLVAVMGNDAAIVEAARISYGSGTKSVREDRGLIRYLMRHHHTSPFELNAIKLHIKAPIFVLRQLFRHRTHAANEYSARYSVMSDEFYVPDSAHIQPQSSGNKQGRAGTITEMSADGAQWMMQAAGEHAYQVYRVLLGERDDEVIYDPYSSFDPLLDEEFPGIARELARTVLPVSYYSELYWQQNLHNLFHLLKLRADSHAQYEIRVYAEAIYQLIQPLFPVACEAWTDYVRDAVSLSRMEVNLLRDALAHPAGFAGLLDAHGEQGLRDHYGLTKREMDEFKTRLLAAK